MIFPTNYNWVNNTLSFTYDDTDTDGVWIEFKMYNSADFVTILKVEGSNPKTCNLDPQVYGISGVVRGTAKPKNTQGWPPLGGNTNITNQVI